MLGRQLKGEIVEKDATHLSKVSRLMEQLKESRSEHVEVNLHLDQMQTDREADNDAQTAELTSEQSKNKAMENAMANNVQWHQQRMHEEALIVEALEEQLISASEQKRLDANRIFELKRELAATELRHAQIVEDLNKELRVLQASNTHVPDDYDEDSEGASGHRQLNARLKEVLQDFNFLKNDAESEKVLFAQTLEQERYDHAVTSEKFVEAERLVASLREKLQVAEDSLAKDRASAQATETTHAVPAPTAVSSSSGLLSLLCPGRKRHSQEQKTSCQAAVWQVVAALRGVVAVQVAIADMRIKTASRRAFEVWGSATLCDPRAALSNLFFDAVSGTWFRNQIASRISACSDFWSQDVGCLEFCSKSGKTFDASIIVAHIPAETALGNEAALVVVIEPVESERRPPKGTSRHSRPGGVSGAYGSSSVASSAQRQSNLDSEGASFASSDIGPNDSISNVF
jgi:hypothetical protein